MPPPLNGPHVGGRPPLDRAGDGPEPARRPALLLATLGTWLLIALFIVPMIILVLSEMTGIG